MARKIVKQIISVTLLSTISAFLSYLANSTLIFDKLVKYGIIGTTIDISTIQDYCLWIGIAVSTVGLSLNLIVTIVKHDHILEQRNSLIKMNKSILSSSLGKRFLSDSSSFDIRIFVPKNPLLYKTIDKLHIRNVKRFFSIKNIDLIAEQGITKDLQFEVYPNQEGLVGICYQNKMMVYDDDLEHTNGTGYQLNKNQIDRTSNLKWSICWPVCDKDDAVVAVIALDGKNRITIDKEKEAILKEELVAFSCLLFDSVPQLFKR